MGWVNGRWQTTADEGILRLTTVGTLYSTLQVVGGVGELGAELGCHPIALNGQPDVLTASCSCY